MIHWKNVIVLVILALLALAQNSKTQETPPEEADFLSKHFFTDFTRAKRLIAQSESLTRSDLYGFSLINRLNVQQHIYQVFH